MQVLLLCSRSDFHFEHLISYLKLFSAILNGSLLTNCMKKYIKVVQFIVRITENKSNKIEGTK